MKHPIPIGYYSTLQTLLVITHCHPKITNNTLSSFSGNITFEYLLLYLVHLKSVSGIEHMFK